MRSYVNAEVQCADASSFPGLPFCPPVARPLSFLFGIEIDLVLRDYLIVALTPKYQGGGNCTLVPARAARRRRRANQLSDGLWRIGLGQLESCLRGKPLSACSGKTEGMCSALILRETTTDFWQVL